MPDPLADELFHAKRLMLPWAKTAAAVTALLAEAGEAANPRSQTLMQLSGFTGYSIPILLRQVGLLNFLDEVAIELGVEAASLRDRPFSVLELASTLYNRERAEGLRALKDILAGGADVRSLRKAIDELRSSDRETSGPETAARERHERQKRIFKILGKSGRRLEPRPRDWGVAEARIRGLAHPPVCRFTWWSRIEDRGSRFDRLEEADLRVREGQKLLEGFDLLYAPSGSTSKWLDDRIARILASATFFDLYWILIAEPTPFLDRIAQALDIPPRPEIGIAVVDPAGYIVEPLFRAANLRWRSAEEKALIKAFAPDRTNE